MHNRLKIFLAIFFSGLALHTFADDKHDFQNTKNLDIFFNLYKQLDQYYVDSIKPEKVIRSGIDAMLDELDPYTNYITEEDLDDFKFITTGEYGGIGSMVSAYKGNIYISEPYENMPAAKAGLKAGDLVLEIDGQSLKGKTISQASEMLKGQPNTVLKIKIQRGNKAKPQEISVVRQKITINTVPYYGVIGSNTGYILISSFTDKTSGEVKNAFLELKSKHNISSLIIDLRNNGGGIMEEAIKIINFFVPKGLDLVSTRGKVKQWDRTYKSSAEPLDTDIPIAVLVNRGSASASEIVAGSLQDLDRAVIIGERSFGKGLVQTTRPISFNGSLKVTTAKYYTPSGRCVQAIDYSHRNADGSVGAIPDSLTHTFYTKNKRQVRDGGGITPDIKIENEKVQNILYYLVSDFVVFDFATQFVSKHPSIAPVTEFAIDDQTYTEFKEFAKARHFTYDRQSEKALKELEEVTKFEGYYDGAEAEFKALKAKLTHDLDKSLTIFSTDIRQLLASEIVKRYYYQKGEIAYSLRNDKEVKKAIEIVSDAQKTKEILEPVVKTDAKKR